MNKTDIALARNSLLELWQFLIQDAVSRQQREKERLMNEAHPEQIRVPPLIIPCPSSDMVQLLLSGIASALAGNPDPFKIKPPGRRPNKTRQERIEIVAELRREMDDAKARGLRAWRQFALDTVAGRHDVPVDTLTALLDDNDIRGWAELQKFRKTRKN